jgi:hypothetical protein
MASALTFDFDFNFASAAFDLGIYVPSLARSVTVKITMESSTFDNRGFSY